VIAAIGLCGLALASTIGSLLLARVMVLAWPEHSSAPERRAPEAVAEQKPSPEPRLAPPREQAQPAPEPVPPAPKPEPPPLAFDPSGVCDLPLRLTAATFDAVRPERSLIMVRGAEPDSSRVAFTGTRFGEHTLVEILPRAARFVRGGQSCWLRMFGASAREKLEVERANAKAQQKAAKRRGKRARTPAVEPYPPTRALTRAELARAIRKVEPGSYLLDRQLLSKALARWDHVAATTRISTTKRGSGRGLRIVSLRDAGLLAGIGLRSGDVLREINGRAIKRKRDLRGAIVELSGSEQATLTLERGDHPMTLDYAVR
jgi:hypothetical protein